ncbi:MAG: hypothetical protein R3C24_11270 [Cyanobacteriota/Melainabacteria group bacterium]
MPTASAPTTASFADFAGAFTYGFNTDHGAFADLLGANDSTFADLAGAFANGFDADHGAFADFLCAFAHTFADGFDTDHSAFTDFLSTLPTADTDQRPCRLAGTNYSTFADLTGAFADRANTFYGAFTDSLYAFANGLGRGVGDDAMVVFEAVLSSGTLIPSAFSSSLTTSSGNGLTRRLRSPAAPDAV